MGGGGGACVPWYAAKQCPGSTLTFHHVGIACISLAKTQSRASSHFKVYWKPDLACMKNKKAENYVLVFGFAACKALLCLQPGQAWLGAERTPRHTHPPTPPTPHPAFCSSPAWRSWLSSSVCSLHVVILDFTALGSKFISRKNAERVIADFSVNHKWLEKMM